MDARPGTPASTPSGKPSTPSRAPADESPAASAAVGAGRQRGLMWALFGGNAAVFAVYMGVGQILLPTQVGNIDPDHKVTSLGIITGIGAAFATLLQPIGGALSDRTRSRFGRRNPWMLGGAVVALAFLVLMGSAHGLLLLGVGWVLAQGAANLVQAALTAIVPDRVPRERRGTASAMVGAGTTVATVVGGLIASRFVDHLGWGYATLGLVLVAAMAMMLTTHDPRPDELPASAAAPAPGFREAARSFLSALAVPDFRWVFLGRALIILSYFSILGYLLYMLDDHITGVPSGMKHADAVVLLSTVSAVVSIVSTVVGGPLSDKLDRRRAFVGISGAGMAVSLLIPLFAPTWGAMLAFSVLNGLFFGVYMAVDTSLVTLVLPSEGDAGRDMAVLNIANAGPQIVSPFVAALVINGLGGYSALYIVAAVLALLGGATVLPIKGVR